MPWGLPDSFSVVEHREEPGAAGGEGLALQHQGATLRGEDGNK